MVPRVEPPPSIFFTIHCPFLGTLKCPVPDFDAQGYNGGVKPKFKKKSSMIVSCLVANGINFSGVPSLDETGNRIPVTLSLKLHELAAPGDSPLHAPSVLLSKGSFSETLHLCPSARNIASYKPDTCLRQAGQRAGQRGVLAGPTDATDATMMCREAKVQGNGPRSSRLRSTSRWKREQMRSIPERTSWRNTPLEPRGVSTQEKPRRGGCFFCHKEFL